LVLPYITPKVTINDVACWVEILAKAPTTFPLLERKSPPDLL